MLADEVSGPCGSRGACVPWDLFGEGFAGVFVGFPWTLTRS